MRFCTRICVLCVEGQTLRAVLRGEEERGVEDGKVYPPVGDDSASVARFRRTFTSSNRMTCPGRRKRAAGPHRLAGRKKRPDEPHGHGVRPRRQAAVCGRAGGQGTHRETRRDARHVPQHLHQVDSSGERGLRTLTFDPSFSTNGYVYLHYTRKATSSTPVHNRVVRVTASGDKVVAGSEKLIFKLGNQTSNHHMGGALEFESRPPMARLVGTAFSEAQVQEKYASWGGLGRQGPGYGRCPTG